MFYLFCQGCYDLIFFVLSSVKNLNMYMEFPLFVLLHVYVQLVLSLASDVFILFVSAFVYFLFVRLLEHFLFHIVILM